MKKKLSVVVLVCIIFSLLCGCTTRVPSLFPGKTDGDENFVWVCKEPFAYFSLDKEKKVRSSPCLKGYFEKDGELPCLYLYFMPIGGTTELCEAEKFYDEDLYNTVVGYADYRKNYFDFEVEYDNINFFDGELPTLRFEKMTK